jgi:hypothetical protein
VLTLVVNMIARGFVVRSQRKRTGKEPARAVSAA